jgi:mannose/cellobiose epimerase-like protein (N-acyl-D-glucosamine 2-epimerase family)
MGLNYRDPGVLREHIRRIIDFYHPACIDTERGGYINQFTDDGTIYDRDTKHLVGTCRFVFNYAVAAKLFDDEEYRSAAAHGVAFLQSGHRQSDGGFAWVLGAHGVEDGARRAYGHAFVLLAAAMAARIGVGGADTLIGEVYDLLEQRFWEPDARLYADEIGAGDWRAVDPYRGQNANMHLCEAMLAAFETTREARYLDRARTLANRICVELAAPVQGMIWEHYTTDWEHDWNYNRDDPGNLFRPYGYLPGHFAEWAKLLLILERHRPEPWQLPAAVRLFDTALAFSWDEEYGGMHYTFAPDEEILDTDRYYWVLAETVAAAAVLAVRTGAPRYWDWYDRAWQYADRHFVDHVHGAWYRVLDRAGRRYDDRKSPASKTDYHPLGACYEILRVLR